MLSETTNNRLQFNTERAEVGGIVVCCMLHDSAEGETWYATEDGGALRIEHDGVSNPLIEQHRIRHVLYLPNAEEVAKHIRTAIYSHFNTHGKQLLLFDRAFQSFTAVSLYQGYFKPTDSDERRCTVILTLAQALAELGWPNRWNGFTTLVYNLLLDDGMSPLNWYFLEHLPAGVIGPLVAHGLRFKNLWEFRYKEAMMAGWRYQLDHPAEEFGNRLASSGTCFYGPIIDTAAEEIVADLLKTTGIDALQAERARETAAAIAGDDPPMYSKMLLMLLSTMANGEVEASIKAEISLPNDLVP